MDASNILKPVLASGEMRCIGSTTYQEYRSYFERDRALARRFQKIEIAEPTIERDAPRSSRASRRTTRSTTASRYTDAALRAAAELSAKHINDRHLPDKAIDVIDEAGAIVADAARRPARRRRVRAKDVEHVVATIARIPPRSVSIADRERLADARARPASSRSSARTRPSARSCRRSSSRAPASASPRSRSARSCSPVRPASARPRSPSSSPSALGVAFLRFDMSEYMEKHTVSRLIGAPPGYVGFDQGGLLTDGDPTSTPHAVLLLDEIEKAHPDLFNILLQVMDHATLTDNNGRKADFRHVILIMTTNAGARRWRPRRSASAAARTPTRAARRSSGCSAPEFRNRLDAIMSVRLAAHARGHRARRRQVHHGARRAAEREEGLRRADAGGAPLSRREGLRPDLRRAADGAADPDRDQARLADEILFGRLQDGGKARSTAT